MYHETKRCFENAKINSNSLFVDEILMQHCIVLGVLGRKTHFLGGRTAETFFKKGHFKGDFSISFFNVFSAFEESQCSSDAVGWGVRFFFNIIFNCRRLNLASEIPKILVVHSRCSLVSTKEQRPSKTTSFGKKKEKRGREIQRRIETP